MIPAVKRRICKQHPLSLSCLFLFLCQQVCQLLQIPDDKSVDRQLQEKVQILKIHLRFLSRHKGESGKNLRRLFVKAPDVLNQGQVLKKGKYPNGNTIRFQRGAHQRGQLFLTLYTDMEVRFADDLISRMTRKKGDFLPLHGCDWIVLLQKNLFFQRSDRSSPQVIQRSGRQKHARAIFCQPFYRAGDTVKIRSSQFFQAPDHLLFL